MKDNTGDMLHKGITDTAIMKQYICVTVHDVHFLKSDYFSCLVYFTKCRNIVITTSEIAHAHNVR